MFVLFGINTRTKQPERVTQNASAAALRRMWSAYPSAAIGGLGGDADDVEMKPGTDRTHVAALTRAIVRAQRGDVTANAEPADDRNTKPAKVMQPAPVEPPAEDNEPEDDPAPALTSHVPVPIDVPVEEIPDAVPTIAPPYTRRRETPAPLPAVDERTLPAHAQRRSRIDAPCPVPGCDDRAAPYLSVLPEPLRALCARHRTHAQRLRAGEREPPAHAVEMVMEASRPAPPPPAAEVKDFLSEPDPRMVADAPEPQVALTRESTDELLARLGAALDASHAQCRAQREDAYPLGHVPRFDDAASAGGQVLRITNGARVDADEATALRAFLGAAEERGLDLQLIRADGATVRIPSEKALALDAGRFSDAESLATPPPIGPIDDAALAPIFDRLDAVAAAATPPSDALTRADFAAVLRELRGALRVALDVAITRLESPR